MENISHECFLQLIRNVIYLKALSGKIENSNSTAIGACKCHFYGKLLCKKLSTIDGLSRLIVKFSQTKASCNVLLIADKLKIKSLAYRTFMRSLT